MKLAITLAVLGAAVLAIGVFAEPSPVTRSANERRSLGRCP